MASIFQTLRSAVSRRRPADGARKVGELFINMADRQIGFIDDQKKAQDLIAVPFFSPAATYTIGDVVREGSDIYRCKTAVAQPAAFDAKVWDRITSSPGDFVMKTGDKMSGDLHIEKADPSLILTKTAVAQHAAVRGFLNDKLRWAISLGNNTPETGSNVGSDFAVYRHDDAGVAIDPSLIIDRKTGNTTFTNAVAAKSLSTAAVRLGDAASQGLTLLGYRNDTWAEVCNIVNAGTSAVNYSLYGFYTAGTAYGIRMTLKAGWEAEVLFQFLHNGQGQSPAGWVQTSDRRLKDNITPIADALSKVNRITGCTFTRNDLGGTKMAGVIAQEIEAVLPEGVVQPAAPDGFKGVDPMPIVGLLIEAVKELSAEVAALKAARQL